MREPIHERIVARDDFCDSDIRAASTDVVDLPGGLLAIDIDPGGADQFTLFDHTGGEGTADSPFAYKVIVYGIGYSSLRELRHTFWGTPRSGEYPGGHSDGYIFYPNAKLIAAAFEALKRWFDCD